MCDIRYFRRAWIDYKSDMLTRWETDTRYDIDYCVEKNKVLEGLSEVKHFLYVNGLHDGLREELQTEETRKNLKSFLPKRYEPSDSFEWNCYYQIYRKRIEQTDTEEHDHIVV